LVSIKENTIATNHQHNQNKSGQNLKVKASTKNILEEYQFEHFTIETELDDESCNLV